MTPPRNYRIKTQVRLEPDVEPRVSKSAKENSRSLTSEVNHTLRKVYKKTK